MCCKAITKNIMIFVLLFLSGCVQKKDNASEINLIAHLSKEEYIDVICEVSKIFRIPLAYANDVNYCTKLYQAIEIEAKTNAQFANYVKTLVYKYESMKNDIEGVTKMMKYSQNMLFYQVDSAIERYKHPNLKQLKEKPKRIKEMRKSLEQLDSMLRFNADIEKNFWHKYGLDKNADIHKMDIEGFDILFDGISYVIDYIESHDSIDEKFEKELERAYYAFLYAIFGSFGHAFVYEKLINEIASIWSLDFVQKSMPGLKLPEAPKVEESDHRLYMCVPLFWSLKEPKNIKVLNKYVDDINSNKVGKVLLKQLRNVCYKTGSMVHIDTLYLLGQDANLKNIVNVSLPHEITRNSVLINTDDKYSIECFKDYRSYVLFHELKHFVNGASKGYALVHHLCNNYLYDKYDKYPVKEILFNDEELHVIIGLYDDKINYVDKFKVLSVENLNRMKFERTYKKGTKFKSFDEIYSVCQKHRDQYERLCVKNPNYKPSPKLDLINEFTYKAIRDKELGYFEPRYQHAYVNHYRYDGFKKLLGIIAKHYNLKFTEKDGKYIVKAGKDFYKNLEARLDALDSKADKEWEIIKKEVSLEKTKNNTKNNNQANNVQA